MSGRRSRIKPIASARKRSVSYAKRKAGLMKKAYELSILCSCDIALWILSEEGTVQFSSTNMEDLIDRWEQYEGEPHESKTVEDFAKAGSEEEKGARREEEIEGDGAESGGMEGKVCTSGVSNTVEGPTVASAWLPGVGSASGQLRGQRNPREYSLQPPEQQGVACPQFEPWTPATSHATTTWHSPSPLAQNPRGVFTPMEPFLQRPELPSPVTHPSHHHAPQVNDTVLQTGLSRVWAEPHTWVPWSPPFAGSERMAMPEPSAQSHFWPTCWRLSTALISHPADLGEWGTVNPHHPGSHHPKLDMVLLASEQPTGETFPGPQAMHVGERPGHQIKDPMLPEPSIGACESE